MGSLTRKKIQTVYPLLLFVLLYFVSVLLKNDLWGNILSPLVAFFSALLILSSMKVVKTHKAYGVLLFCCSFVWGVADFFWLIYENIFFSNPVEVPYINGLYVFPNVFFTGFLSLYIYKNRIYWNLQQFFIDIFTFTAIGMVLVWAFIFSKTGLQFTFDFNYILIIVYVFFDFLIMVEIGLICFSKSFKNINFSLSLILVSFAVFVLADFYYAYLSLMESYKANTIIDFVYIISIVLFSFASVHESLHPSVPKALSKDQLSENLRKPKKTGLLVVLLFFLFYLLDFFSFITLMLAVFIFVLYWVLTTNIRANMLDRLLLKTEKEMNEHLEKKIQERTKELSFTNQHLEEISNRDALTGLYNRRYLINYLDVLTSSEETKPFALLYIDTNRFKPINDSYGHEIGDKVLFSLGMRLLEYCTAKCTAFRIGGDEFAVILRDFNDVTEVSAIAEKILEKLQLPISLPPYSFTLSASIGIALYPRDAKKKDVLLRYADIAMYEVKSSDHKNDYLFFDKVFTEKINKRHELEFLLQNADYDKEFKLYYQPQYSTENQTLVGMEALIRWIHPQRGFIPPSDFIPIAEENGLIIDIGEWVIDNAFAQIKKWNQSFDEKFRMSINISPIQIKNTGFLEWFVKKIEKENMNPEWIDLEITESVAMISTTSIEKIFDLLNDIGVNISIDDFGTGYSSLSYIRKYKIDRLKIAKELIDNIDHDENALLIVQAIIMMAKGMQLKTISEGVEDTSQLAILNGLGCDEIQGYIFGKPVPSDEFEKQHFAVKNL